MRSGRLRAAVLALPSALLLTACQDSTFGNITETLDAVIANSDTTMFLNTTVSLRAVAQYTIGPGEPTSVSWGTADTAKVRLVVSTVDRTVRVTALDTGSAEVFAIINQDFIDSVQLDIVQSGLVRARRALSGAPAFAPALDDSSNVFIATSGAQDLLLGLRRGGTDTLFNAASCPAGFFGPAVRTDLAFLVTGAGCTSRLGVAGNVEWTRAVGNAGAGAAFAANAEVVIAAAENDGAGGEAVVLMRLGTAGDTIWRDTLAAGVSFDPQSAPSINSDGAIYVTWRAGASDDSLARVAGGGARGWTRALPGSSAGTSPALSGTAVYVTYPGGVIVFDTAGTELWRGDFSADIPGASGATVGSSPVIDRGGDVYVQTEDGLVSYTSAGVLRWAADSLGGGSAAAGVPAPTILLNSIMIVTCGAGVCGVDTNDGSLIWRSAIGTGAGTAAVGINGEIYIVRRTGAGTGELVELWGNRLPEFSGWPTEGGIQNRQRRRL